MNRQTFAKAEGEALREMNALWLASCRRQRRVHPLPIRMPVPRTNAPPSITLVILYLPSQNQRGDATVSAALKPGDYIRALGCGLPSVERRMRYLMALQAFLDDSGSTKSPSGKSIKDCRAFAA